MDKKNICRKAAERSCIPEDVIRASMDAVEDTVKLALISGQQIHWGGFLRSWMITKHPFHYGTGCFKYKDRAGKKLRCMVPCCEFGKDFFKLMKDIVVNIEEENWREEWENRAIEAVEKRRRQRDEARYRNERKEAGYDIIQEKRVF